MANTDTKQIYSVAFGKVIAPDRWQRQFATNEWPEILVAPTGSGKTAGVTLGWAAHRLRAPKTTPCRLVWCLPMRTLVDQTGKAVKQWFGRLRDRKVAERVLPGPDDVYILMGGVEAARWLDHPERPTVIIGTQDMLLSRALMRGYASSRAIWPMEFALLHRDTQWVFDEVQLMGAGRATSSQLEAFRRCDAERAERQGEPPRCPARSLWISATLEPHWLETVDFPAPPEDAICRVDPQHAQDARLRKLTTAKKALKRSTTVPTSAKAGDLRPYVVQLARSVLKAHQAGRMTLTIVNRVSRAQELHTALAEQLKQKTGKIPELALIHGRFRSVDRRREMDKVAGSDGHENSRDLIVVATQAVEAGVDISAAVLFSELAPWPAMVQRFGRANRYAELREGADVHWIDLLANAVDGKSSRTLSLPYRPDDLKAARRHLHTLTDVAAANLPAPGDIDPPRRVIRRSDLDDLFDTDPDLTGFDVDISPYVRDADDTDVRVFWRDLSVSDIDPPRPHAEELCAVPIGSIKDWVNKVHSQSNARVYIRDPLWRRTDNSTRNEPPGWKRLTQAPWPGLTLLADVKAGGYSDESGFTGNPKHVPRPLFGGSATSPVAAQLQGFSHTSGEAEGHDEDPWSQIGVPILLSAHLRHVAAEAEALCDELGVFEHTRAAILRAARWHDVGKVHHVFQNTMRRGLGDREVEDGPLAKTIRSNMRYERPYFRHELASAVALLAHDGWSRNADLVAYLIAAHHGKVRMNLRALPLERPPTDSNRLGARFARGIWDHDELSAIDVCGREQWRGGPLNLSVMELGLDETTRESWTERTRGLLARFGPFHLSWLETLVRLADWRASAKEQERSYEF